MTHVLTLHRTFAAPPERVFAAWTTPEIFARWIGPVGVPCAVLAMDPAGDGRFRLRMTPSSGTVIHIDGRFTALVPHQRIDFTWNAKWDATPREPAGRLTSHATVRLRASDLGTEMEFRHHLPDADMIAGHRKGWTTTFDKLQQNLEA